MRLLDPNIQGIPSPHFGSRRGYEVVGTVVHYTAAGGANATASWFANPNSKVSAHFIVSRSGRIIQCVDTSMAAWHAGVSEMSARGEMTSNANAFTIGVEFANHGYLVKENGQFFYELGRQLKPYRRADPIKASLRYDNGTEITGYWEPYTDEALDAFQWLRGRIKQVHGEEAAHHLVGHEEIGIPLGRKLDPGPLFPWERFSRKTGRRTTCMVLQ